MTDMTEKTFIGLIHLLAELKKRGYTEVWLNHPSPHWSGDGSGAIVAAPKRRRGSWPAVWDLHYDPLIGGLLGRMSCGNGLKNADEAQYNDMSKNIPPSYYKLVGEEWLTQEELQ
jgi:hypothetical protein